MVKVASREAWNARPPSRLMPKATYPETKCYIHHEAGSLFQTENPEMEKLRMRSIQDYTMGTRGYADIPYSFGQMPSGRAYEGRDYTWDDSATGGENGTAISIFFPGDYQRQYPTDASLDNCAELIVFGITLGHLTRNCAILGHNQSPGASTACPGKNLIACLPGIRDRVAGLLKPQSVSIGELMSVLPVIIPASKAGMRGNGNRYCYFSHTDNEIIGWNGASIGGDHPVPPTTDAESVAFIGKRARSVPVSQGQKIIGLMYGTIPTSTPASAVDYQTIVAVASDGATFAYTST